MQTMIMIRNLRKTYPGAAAPAVDGLDFYIRKGEIFSLLGPNGAGKTTTLSMMSCLIEPDEGEIEVAGFSTSRQPLEVKRTIGVVPQDIALYPNLSARENLLFWGRMSGLGGSELRQRTEDMLTRVSLADRANDRIETFSGGMKRRINIAVGLLHQPQVLFMDEPTVGIDPQSRRSILEMIKTLNEDGMTILYTTHYMEEAQELSDRIGIIDRGKLMALGTLGELTHLVGEHDILEIQTGEEFLPPELTPSLEAHPEVHRVTPDIGTMQLLVEDGNRTLADILQVFNQNNVRVSSVNIREPNLEAVFLHLTGRALRD
jgi:ABC-2 type transport system ATP-binding protein